MTFERDCACRCRAARVEAVMVAPSAVCQQACQYYGKNATGSCLHGSCSTGTFVVLDDQLSLCVPERPQHVVMQHPQRF